MPLVLVTAPVAEPITLAEAKAHLRVDHDDENTLITTLITAVRKKLQIEYRRTFVNTTYDLKLDCFPDGREPILIPSGPLVSVSSFAYIDTAGTSTTIPDEGLVLTASPSLGYRLDTSSLQPRITPAHGFYWPSSLDITNAITIRMVLGYGAAASSVPETIKQACLLLLADWYRFRGDEAINEKTGQALESLLWNDRAYSFA